MPTCSAPSSVQQNIQYLRLCGSPHKRENWPFAGSEQAGQQAAAIKCLLATAKANGLDPRSWLSQTLARLPTTLNRDLDNLLPLRRD